MKANAKRRDFSCITMVLFLFILLYDAARYGIKMDGMFR